MAIRGLSRRRLCGLCAGAGAALAVLAGAALPGPAGAATAATAASAPVTLSAAPLGVDVAPWDGDLANSITPNSAQSSVQQGLKAAGVNQLHYGGGVTGDLYDWQTNTDIQGCTPNTAIAEFTDTTCATDDALGFNWFSTDARALGAQSFVNVNYGTGTPDMAAAWVTKALTNAPGQAVTDWEIGNESYGCWEANNWLAQPPENYQGYLANKESTCPMDPANLGLDQGMQTMATSYAVNAGTYMAAMKQADPNAQLGVPWAFDWTVGGATVGDNGTWNDTVLGTDAQYIDFVDAHYYPFGFGGITGTGTHPTDQTVIRSVTQIPAEMAKIQTELAKYPLQAANVIVGETGVSFLPTNVPCTPAGALFAAGDALEWLAAGAQAVDWWSLDSGNNAPGAPGPSNPQGLCLNPEEAMFTPTGVRTSPYYGYLLASKLAQPNAQLSTLTTSDPTDVLAFQSVLPGGKVAVALINTNTSSAEKVTAPGTSTTGVLATQTYSAGNQNASNSKIVPGWSSAAALAGGITLPAESITVLTQSTVKPTALTLTGSATVKAGTKFTLKGSLSLNGAAAPAGVPVTVYRNLGSKTQATLTAKTVAGGGFTVTDLPPAAGSYVYQASYAASSSYPAGSVSTAVKVTLVKPALKLKLSATSVRPGQKITVTATLGAPHVNKTLVIYAQQKGGAKKVIKRATVNAKGQLSVVYPVKANTTFTVVFAGDTWYTAASVTAAVKA